MIEVEPRSSDVSAVASLNAWLPRLESVLGRFIDVRPALLKALGPIVVTPVPERSTTARLAVEWQVDRCRVGCGMRALVYVSIG